MVTTVGTETHIVDLLSDLIQLDYDAADAYQAAIDRIGNRQFAAALSAFREDHLQHVAELSTILTAMGQMPPEQGDMKSLLTRGKVVLGGLLGDRAILEAMRTNEADTNTAYERAVAPTDLDDATRGVLQRAFRQASSLRVGVVHSRSYLRDIMPAASRGLWHQLGISVEVTKGHHSVKAEIQSCRTIACPEPPLWRG